MPRRSLSIALTALLATSYLALLGCSREPLPAHSSSPVIKLASYEWPGSYWIEVAYAKGWFREAGLNVERYNADRRYFKALDEVADGKLDAIGFSQFDLVRHVAAGEDLVGIVALDYSTGAEALLAKPGIHSLRELIGKRLALHRGTYLEYLLSIVAEREGVRLADIVLTDRTSEESVADFKDNKVDAVMVWEPYGTELRATGASTLFTAADFPGLTSTVFAMRRAFIVQHPREVAALMRVWNRAGRYVREHPEESCQIASTAFEDPVENVRALMSTVRVLDLADNVRAFSYAAGFESLHGSWRRMNDFMIDRGMVTARVDSPSHLDAGFIRPLE